SSGQLDGLRDQLQSASLAWDSAGLPVEFRAEESRFRENLENLKAQATIMRQLGATRMNTWIMPTHDSLSYRQNFARHAERLRICAQIVGEQGVRLGLEYVGPKT